MSDEWWHQTPLPFKKIEKPYLNQTFEFSEDEHSKFANMIKFKVK